MNIDLSKYETKELYLIIYGCTRVLPVDEDEKTNSLAWEIIADINRELGNRN